MIFSYRPNDDEAVLASLLARRRNRLGSGTNIPGGENADRNERFIKQYGACLSEIATSRILNLSWTGCGKGTDGSKDVGGIIEVRSILSRGKGLLARNKDDDASPCVLVFLEQTRLCTLLGWEYFGNVKKNGRVIDENTEKPCWILKENELRPIEELIELLGELLDQAQRLHHVS